MNSFKAPLLLLILLLLGKPTVVQAQFHYVNNNDGTITITEYYGVVGPVTIPETIDDLLVTGIASGAFENSLNLTGVRFPNSLTSIGNDAFSGCNSLTTATVPNGVTKIGYSAFARCTSLTAIAVDSLNHVYSSADGVLIDKSQTRLIQCPGGKGGNYVIPSGVTSIGDSAFGNCTGLTSVTIPDSVTRIEWGAFDRCTSLASVTIGNSVKTIEALAFNQCTSLVSVTIPASVVDIEGTTGNSGNPYSNCTSLKAINVDPLNPSYSSVEGVLFDKSQTTLFKYPEAKAGGYIIPNSVTNIQRAAFDWSTGLKQVYFQGNAPSLASEAEVFTGTDATVFYLPGTTGWGTTFGGLQTTLWVLPNPVIQSGSSFAELPNGFGFTISWATNKSVVVEASQSLTNLTWSPIGTNTLVGGSSYFTDPQWTKYPNRFYRLRSL